MEAIYSTPPVATLPTWANLLVSSKRWNASRTARKVMNSYEPSTALFSFAQILSAKLPVQKTFFTESSGRQSAMKLSPEAARISDATQKAVMGRAERVLAKMLRLYSQYAREWNSFTRVSFVNDISPLVLLAGELRLDMFSSLDFVVFEDASLAEQLNNDVAQLTNKQIETLKRKAAHSYFEAWEYGSNKAKIEHLASSALLSKNQSLGSIFSTNYYRDILGPVWAEQGERDDIEWFMRWFLRTNDFRKNRTAMENVFGMDSRFTVHSLLFSERRNFLETDAFFDLMSRFLNRNPELVTDLLAGESSTRVNELHLNAVTCYLTATQGWDEKLPSEWVSALITEENLLAAYAWVTEENKDGRAPLIFIPHYSHR